jgi:hypothetical protein
MYKEYLRFISILVVLMGGYLSTPLTPQFYKDILEGKLLLHPFFFVTGGLLSLFFQDWKVYSVLIVAHLLYFSVDVILTNFIQNQTLPLAPVILIPLAIYSARIAGLNSKIANSIP